ncbi:MAG TPA: PAS domain-containing protein, partial [Dongiaceae bacterium]
MVAQIGAPAAAARAHEELFAYWASLKEGARLPGRRHVDPGGIKRLLPTVSLIDVVGGDPPEFRVRLAGTAL